MNNDAVNAAAAEIERHIGFVMGGRGFSRAQAVGRVCRFHTGLYTVLRAGSGKVLHPLVRESEIVLANEAAESGRAEFKAQVEARMAKNPRMTYDDAFSLTRKTHGHLLPGPANARAVEMANETKSSRAAAGKAFVQIVNEVMDRDKINWDAAWSKARQENPDEYAAMSA